MSDPPCPPAPRFLVDSMLVKLGTYLRCLGYDAEWAPESTLAARILRADREDRWFVTRHRHLEHQQKLPRRFVRVESDDPVAQLAELARSLRIDLAERTFTRCIRCNVELLPRERDESLRSRVGERTFAAYAHFFRCPRCETVFWRGSHVRNTCRKLGLADLSEPGTSEAQDTGPAAEDARG